jgi:NADPH2:quinone reductase
MLNSKTMKAAVIYQAGNADQLILEERAIPVPKTGQLLIKIRAFGLNRSELMTRKGFSPDVVFPRVLGIECVGEVEYDPSGKLRKGQQVAAFMGHMGRLFDGSYAEYVVLPQQIVMPFDSELPWETLGALPEMWQTAYGSLHVALKIKASETLLIRGGTSSVGLLAAQLAKSAGLKVIATTRDNAKTDLLVANGADQVWIDNGTLSATVDSEDFPKIDKILELIGTTTLKDSLHSVIPGGSVCMTGMLAEQWSIEDFDPMGYIPAAVNLTTYNTGEIRVADELFQHFLTQVEQGIIVPPIKKVFRLQEIVAAHLYMESNAGGGKIVVTT